MKTTSGAFDTASQAPQVAVVLFLEFDFAGGAVYLNTSNQNINWNSQNWLGAGSVTALDPVEETEALQVVGMKATISGVPSAYLSLALAQAVQGATAKIWVALLNTDTYTIVSDPVLEWQGTVDQLLVDDSPAAAKVTVTMENRLSDFKRPQVRRYNDADQQQYLPGDVFFQYTPQMVDAQLVWPAKAFFAQ